MDVTVPAESHPVRRDVRGWLAEQGMLDDGERALGLPR